MNCLLQKMRSGILWACTALAVASCTTIVPLSSSIEAERLLPENADAYIKLDSKTLYAMLLDFPGMTAKDASLLAGRTRYMVAALSGDGTVLAVADGSYPAHAVAMRLSGDSGWKRSGPVWEHSPSGLRVAFAGSNKLFIGTAPLDSVIAAAAQPARHPIPDQYRAKWDAPVAVYAPRPMGLIRRYMPLGATEIPMTDFFVSAAASGAPTYSEYKASLAFTFDSEHSVRIFHPLCRLFLYSLANRIWPERSATVIDSALWTKKNCTVEAENIPLDSSSLAEMIRLFELF